LSHASQSCQVPNSRIGKSFAFFMQALYQIQDACLSLQVCACQYQHCYRFRQRVH
jgi:hypothetical protein